MTNFRLDSTLAADCFLVGSLPLCDVLLLNDTRYPWAVLVPRVAGLTELMELDAEQGAQLFTEIKLVSRTLSVEPEVTKINVGALGNLVSQLHIHVIGRSSKDAAWPGPVWGVGAAEPYVPNDAATLMQRWQALWAEQLIGS